jgi:delta 1-pyrroline-5-carboxylate dehydrogenase
MKRSGLMLMNSEVRDPNQLELAKKARYIATYQIYEEEPLLARASAVGIVYLNTTAAGGNAALLAG